jgi:hypothetical protein
MLNVKTNPPQSPLVREEATFSSPDKGRLGGVALVCETLYVSPFTIHFSRFAFSK